MTGDHRRKSRSLQKQSREFRIVLLWTSLKYIVLCIVQCVLFLWKHNPVKVVSQRQRRLYFVESYDGVIIKPKFKERVVDLLLTDYRRRQRLLRWVHSKLRSTDVHDFSTCWQDGIVLCALLEAICPGVCPSYHLLSAHNMVKNCRLGIKLANKYLYVPMDLLSPEEMAIAKHDSEFKIIQYISTIKWASQNIKEKWSTLHQSLIAAKTGRCFAKGSGMRNGIVGKRSKFTIVVSDTIGVFNLLVEIRGPNNEYSGERIVSLHQAKGILEKSFDKSDSVKYLEDGVGNTFVRKKIPPRYTSDNPAEHMHLDFQCGEEGTFYVTFVPRRAGIHAVAVKWQNHHVESSPFRIKVYKASNVSTKSLKGAQEKRVIYDSLSLTTIPGADESFEVVDNKDQGSPGTDTGARTMTAVARSKAYTKARQLTVTGRRVLRRIITRNGEDIVIEETISPSLSRQSSVTDTSDDDNRQSRREREEKRNPPSFIGTPVSGVGPPNSPLHGRPTTAKPLGTVLEEKQNSKDNLFKNINLADAVRAPDAQRIKAIKEYNYDTGTGTHEDPTRGSHHQTPHNGGSDVKEEPKMKVITSRGDPLIKYTCTELSEHNILETRSNCGREKEDGADTRSKGDGRGNSMTSFLFKEPTPIQTVRVDRVGQKPPLQRTVSINEYSKPPARRTTSDSTIYQLRRRIISHTASDISETSSELSSDDKQSGTEEDSGLAAPALKLLHSHSLKKACMYISENAITSTLQDDDVINDVISNMSFPVKTKLRSTQSLPILVDKNRDMDAGLTFKGPESIDGKITKQKGKYTAHSSFKQKSSLDKSNDWLNDLHNSFVNVYVTDGREIRSGGDVTTKDPAIPKQDTRYSKRTASTSLDGNSSGTCSNAVARVVSTHKQFINHNSDDETVEGQREGNDDAVTDKVYHKTSLYKDIPHPSVKDRPARGTLKRQWTVFCRKSDSSSDTDANRGVVDTASTDPNDTTACGTGFNTGQSAVNFAPKAKFTSIFIQSHDMSGSSFTQEVMILVPKAKVDKQTQVCDSEITQETGWDIIQGFYLLLRRISVKVPSIMTCPPTVIGEASSDVKSADIDHETKGSKQSDTNSTVSHGTAAKYTAEWPAAPRPDNCPAPSPDNSNLLQVPRDDKSEHTLMTSSDTSSHSMERSKQDKTETSDISDIPKDVQNVHRDGNGQTSDENMRDVLAMRRDENSHASDENIHDVLAMRRDKNSHASDENIHDVLAMRRDENSHASDENIHDVLANLVNAVVPRQKVSSAKYEAVDEWFRRNDNLLRLGRTTQRQQTVDSGFDDIPSYFNRHARFSLPSLRTVNGHIRLHRRPYRGLIPLDPKLINSASSQSLSTEKHDQGNDADDELLFNSSTEHKQDRTPRRRHRLQNREESVSFSDSEINQRHQFVRKRAFVSRRSHVKHFQSHDASIKSHDASSKSHDASIKSHDASIKSHDASIKSHDASSKSLHAPVHAAESKQEEVGNIDKNGPRNTHLKFSRKRIEHMHSFDKSNNDSINTTTDHEDKTGEDNSSISMTKELTHAKKSIMKRKSTTTSSIDSNYCGFGVTKMNRSALLSQLGEFQDLCTTAEIPDEDMSVVTSVSSHRQCQDTTETITYPFEEIHNDAMGSRRGSSLHGIDNTKAIMYPFEEIHGEAIGSRRSSNLQGLDNTEAITYPFEEIHDDRISSRRSSNRHGIDKSETITYPFEEIYGDRMSSRRGSNRQGLDNTEAVMYPFEEIYDERMSSRRGSNRQGLDNTEAIMYPFEEIHDDRMSSRRGLNRHSLDNTEHIYPFENNPGDDIVDARMFATDVTAEKSMYPCEEIPSEDMSVVSSSRRGSHLRGLDTTWNCIYPFQNNAEDDNVEATQETTEKITYPFEGIPSEDMSVASSSRRDSHVHGIDDFGNIMYPFQEIPNQDMNSRRGSYLYDLDTTGMTIYPFENSAEADNVDTRIYTTNVIAEDGGDPDFPNDENKSIIDFPSETDGSDLVIDIKDYGPDISISDSDDVAGFSETDDRRANVKLLETNDSYIDTPETDEGEDDMLVEFDRAVLGDFLDDFDDGLVFKEEDPDDNMSGDACVRAVGAGLHHGLVGTSNSFQVWTEHIATGSLSVNVIGPRSHTVTETSVLYTGDNLYEVSYGVTHPGVYKIYVKWDEVNIVNSPFLCDVTF